MSPFPLKGRPQLLQRLCRRSAGVRTGSAPSEREALVAVETVLKKSLASLMQAYSCALRCAPEEAGKPGDGRVPSRPHGTGGKRCPHDALVNLGAQLYHGLIMGSQASRDCLLLHVPADRLDQQGG